MHVKWSTKGLVMQSLWPHMCNTYSLTKIGIDLDHQGFFWNQLLNELASLVAQRLKLLLAMPETWVQSLGREDPLEKEMATHSSILAWRIPWMEEPGGLQSTGSQSQTRLSDFTFTFQWMNMQICNSFSWSRLTTQKRSVHNLIIKLRTHRVTSLFQSICSRLMLSSSTSYIIPYWFLYIRLW